MATLNFSNFNSVFDLMEVFNTEKACIRFLAHIAATRYVTP